MEIEDVRLGNRDIFFNGHLRESVRDGRYVNAIWALDRTGITADADPDTGTLQGLFLATELYQADDLVGKIIHGLGKGATAGAALAVVTLVEIRPGTPFNLFCEVGSQLDWVL